MAFKITPKRIALGVSVVIVLAVVAAVAILFVVKPPITTSALSAPIVLSQPTFPTANKKITIQTDIPGIVVSVEDKLYYSNTDSVEVEIPNDKVSSIGLRRMQDKLIFRQVSTDTTNVATKFDFTPPAISNLEIVSNSDYKTNYQITFLANEFLGGIVAKNDKGEVVDACKRQGIPRNVYTHTCVFSLGEGAVSLVAKDNVGNSSIVIEAANPEELAPLAAKCDIPQNTTAASVSIKCTAEKVAKVAVDKKLIEVKPEGFTIDVKLQNSYTTNQVLTLEDAAGKKYYQTLSIPRTPVAVAAANFATCDENNLWVQVTGRVNLPSYIAYGSNTSIDIASNVTANLAIGSGPNQLSVPKTNYSASTLVLRDKDGNRIPWGSNVKVTGYRTKSSNGSCGRTIWSSIFERI